MADKVKLQMKTKIKNSKIKILPSNNIGWLGVFFALIMLMSSIGGYIPNLSAQSVGELRDKTENLEENIEKNEEVAGELHARGNTLKAELSRLNNEIYTATLRINDTSAKISQLESKLAKTNKELKRQKKILKMNMRALYKTAGASTVELLVASESFSEFIDQQEYLERVKASVQESTEKVIKLRSEIKAKKKQAENLKMVQTRQKAALDVKKQQQSSLLSRTQGQETKYRSIVKKLESQQREAEKQLAAAIARLARGNFSVASSGTVSAGQAIGRVGNTGLSSGPHLHLEVRRGSQSVNPAPYIKSQPVTPTYINQGYGVYNPIYISGYHPGIDYAPGNGTIRAIASGTLYKGCSNSLLGTSTNPYGYVAIVNHGGFISVYAHMAGGPAACNYNTYW